VGRVAVYYDGWHSLLTPKKVLGFTGPEHQWVDIDPLKMALRTAAAVHHDLALTRFAFRIPRIEDNELAHRYLRAKVAAMQGDGIRVDYDLLRERPGEIPGTVRMKEVSVDVDIGCRVLNDITRTAVDGQPLSAVIIFTGDQDLENLGNFAKSQVQTLQRAGMMRGIDFEVYAPTPEDLQSAIRNAHVLRFNARDYARCFDPRNYITPAREALEQAHQQELADIRRSMMTRNGVSLRELKQPEGLLVGEFVDVRTRYCAFRTEANEIAIFARNRLGLKPVLGRQYALARDGNVWSETARGRDAEKSVTQR